MKKINLLFVGLSLVLISNCATASFTQVGNTFPKHEGPVEVLAEYPKDRLFEGIGVVSSKYGVFPNRGALIQVLRKKAAKHGANAIVIVSKRPMPQDKRPSGPYGFYAGIAASSDMTAIAILIKGSNEESQKLTVE